MRKVTLIITAIVLTLNVYSQSPNWDWAKSAGGNSDDIGRSVCSDANGNVFITGYFKSTSITFGTFTLTNADNTGTTNDIFIVKYDALGNVLWAKSAGGTADENGNSITIDINGNIITTGFYYSDSIAFGSTILTNSTSTTYSDIYIIKYDTNGNVLWAKSAGGNLYDEGSGVCTDLSGNVFVTGDFSGTALFGATSLNSTGSNDIFTVKYDASGNIIWAKSLGGISSDEGTSISADASGNVFISGYFYSPTITSGTTTLNNVGGYDVFLVKYDASGNMLWAKTAGGAKFDFTFTVSVDPNGNVYMGGYFSSTSIAFAATTLINADNTGNSPDIFLVKYDASGNALWAKSIGGIGVDYGNRICTDANGSIFIAGSFASPSINFGATTLTCSSLKDIFLGKYDASGNALWAKSAGGANGETALSICTDVNNNIFITGDFYSPSIYFGPTSLTNVDNTGNTLDMFIAKLNSTVGITEMDNNIDISIAPNPFTSQTNIAFTQVQKNTIIKVVDITGREIRNEELRMQNEKSTTLDMSGHAKGIYFVQITDENKTVVNKKVVVQ